MKIEIGKAALHRDRNYGIDRRSGWSLAWNGHFVFQLVSLRSWTESEWFRTWLQLARNRGALILCLIVSAILAGCLNMRTALRNDKIVPVNGGEPIPNRDVK